MKSLQCEKRTIRHHETQESPVEIIKKPLHATLLIDTSGKQRWQDVSWQPFSDTKFILAEAKRLLELNTVKELTSLRPAP